MNNLGVNNPIFVDFKFQRNSLFILTIQGNNELTRWYMMIRYMEGKCPQVARRIYPSFFCWFDANVMIRCDIFSLKKKIVGLLLLTETLRSIIKTWWNYLSSQHWWPSPPASTQWLLLTLMKPDSSFIAQDLPLLSLSILSMWPLEIIFKLSSD